MIMLKRGASRFLRIEWSRHRAVRQQTKSMSSTEGMEKIPQIAANAVSVQSEKMPSDAVQVKGYDFNQGFDFHKLMQSYKTTGFQATNFGKAIEEINKMLEAKKIPLSEEVVREGTALNPVGREKTNCTIFLGITSNIISSGLREIVRFLVQHNLIDCMVTTAGGIEEDIMKCLAPSYLGDFRLKDKELRTKGLNRIGNLIVPNENYCKFEDWCLPILDKMKLEQEQEGINWTPSKMISRLGKEIDNPESVLYWAYKNNIPIFSPALTDGAVGDCMYFHSFRNPGLRLDIIEDLRRMNSQAVFAAHTGMIIVGGGLIKHHICNANLMRNGADFAVYLNTAQEFDGSDAGATPSEAVSWGKIRINAEPVKVYGEATLLFPLLVAETFVRQVKLPDQAKVDDTDQTEVHRQEVRS
ncbi:deoxyhypusine synthase-like isoform X1 [Apostichopus japonicus]|uniref:deoxyhypusine synthase-like isoform X1 n=2 Tax=Stichopus japonicus TaxID=307972 RepID=UPI003AB375D5